MIRNRGIAFKLSFYILLCCLFIFLIIFGYNYLFSRKIIVRHIEENAHNVSRVTINKIETILLPLERVPRNTAYSLEHTTYSKDSLKEILRGIVEENPEIFGAAIAFEPYAAGKNQRYFELYCYKENGNILIKTLGNENYQYFYMDWYQIPRELNRPVWSEPYYDEGGANIIMSTYSVPFYATVQGKRKLAGIIAADISLSWLEAIIKDIRIGRTGYGFLISRNGVIVTHPSKDLIMNQSIFSIAEERNDPGLREMGRHMIKGDSGFVPYRSFLTGKESWIVFDSLPSSGWSLGVVFPQEELLSSITALNITVLSLGLAGCIALILVIIYVSGSITRPLRVLADATKDIAAGNLDIRLSPLGSKDETGRLTDMFIHMQSALKKYIHELTRTTAEKERFESELRIAREIQMSMIPKTFPPFPEKQEFDIYALLKPAREVGGDFYDFFLLDENRLCFVVGDVSGKGVPAALEMSIIRKLIKMAALDNPDTAEIMSKVNREFTSENELDMFVTTFCAILDITTGEIVYSNAGHCPPLLVHKGGDTTFLDCAPCIAIGFNAEADYMKEKVTLQNQEIIYLYTDGVTDAINRKRERLGQEKMKEKISRFPGGSSRELVEMVIGEVMSFSEGAEQVDDITIMALKYLGRAGSDEEHEKNK
jgi:sigma-B regulation protein RsbU (phosphoserine phosphatase)